MWRDVELRELRIFLMLADELHFGRTAERLGISQPGVSEAVRVLESRLGVKVFDRTSRRLRPASCPEPSADSCASASSSPPRVPRSAGSSPHFRPAIRPARSGL